MTTVGLIIIASFMMLLTFGKAWGKGKLITWCSLELNSLGCVEMGHILGQVEGNGV